MTFVALIWVSAVQIARPWMSEGKNVGVIGGGIVEGAEGLIAEKPCTPPREIRRTRRAHYRRRRDWSSTGPTRVRRKTTRAEGVHQGCWE